ncbi:L(+)-tartrate dehydratase subunit beta [Syntrophomonas wolfei]|jgi:L(+)-tartrate dehydratase beta subunit|uniref:L(+)-tartrate dehydratase subunit beta n=1 Tax=Syntrophomonas wolfei TaxID=863 RepID=UPI0007739736|nr:L(+)-tartrate dehydratase subunit beta [Syntrophomonas wolfei]
MSSKILTTPIQDEELESLAIGDIFYLNGYLISSRDDVHQRLIKQHKKLPIDLAGKAIFHAGPIMQEIEGKPGKYRVISIGPTTSMRMEKYEKEFIAQTGLKLIVGKGGMGQNTVAACQEHTVIHAVFPGGCAVLAANCVEEVEAVEWLDLGMPEAMWVMRVKKFGPLIVSIDTRGNNLFEENKKAFNLKKEAIVEEICSHVDYLE